jgi:hypothetical protein
MRQSIERKRIMADIDPPGSGAADGAPQPAIPAMPSLEDLQHWTGVIGSAQQTLMESFAQAMAAVPAGGTTPPAPCQSRIRSPSSARRASSGPKA